MDIDFRKFDRSNVVTGVNLALLGGNRQPLKALAAWNKGHREPKHARSHRKCRMCGLRIRRDGHQLLNAADEHTACATH